MNKIDVVKVSCCGANENLNIEEVIGLLKSNDKIEIGIGVSKEKCYFKSKRFDWIIRLQERLRQEKLSQKIAFHVNGQWAKEIVALGKLPNEIAYLLNLNDFTRVQLNVIGSGYKFESNEIFTLSNLIESQKDEKSFKFILPANLQSIKFLRGLRNYTKDFDVLYDSSFGKGIQANNFFSLFPDQLQGYAGGLGPENIQEKLEEIDKVQPYKLPIWVDAENKLRNDNCNTLDLNKAKIFATNALTRKDYDKSL